MGVFLSFCSLEKFIFILCSRWRRRLGGDEREGSERGNQGTTLYEWEEFYSLISWALKRISVIFCYQYNVNILVLSKRDVLNENMYNVAFLSVQSFCVIVVRYINKVIYITNFTS